MKNVIFKINLGVLMGFVFGLLNKNNDDTIVNKKKLDIDSNVEMLGLR